MSDDLREMLHRVPPEVLAVDWLSTAEIRRRARRRTRASVVSAVLAIALVTTTGVLLADTWAGPSGAPFAPGLGGSYLSPTGSPGPVTLSASPQEPSPGVVLAQVAEAVLLANSDMPASFTTDELRMMDHTTGTGYVAQFADWPLMRFEACPTFPEVTAHLVQETRTVRSFWRDLVDYARQWVANGHWVERHIDEARAVKSMADVRAVVEQCAVYARFTVDATGFAGDESLRFVERGGGRDANDHMYWTVVRVGRYVSILRLASDVDLGERMAERICQAYPDQC